MPEKKVVKKRKFRVRPKKEFKESKSAPKKKPGKKVAVGTKNQRAKNDRKTGVTKRQVKSKPAKMGAMMNSGTASTGFEPLSMIPELGNEKRGLYAGAVKPKFKKRAKIYGTILPPRF